MLSVCKYFKHCVGNVIVVTTGGSGREAETGVGQGEGDQRGQEGRGEERRRGGERRGVLDLKQ